MLLVTAIVNASVLYDGADANLANLDSVTLNATQPDDRISMSSSGVSSFDDEFDSFDDYDDEFMAKFSHDKNNKKHKKALSKAQTKKKILSKIENLKEMTFDTTQVPKEKVSSKVNKSSRKDIEKAKSEIRERFTDDYVELIKQDAHERMKIVDKYIFKKNLSKKQTKNIEKELQVSFKQFCKNLDQLRKGRQEDLSKVEEAFRKWLRTNSYYWNEV